MAENPTPEETPKEQSAVDSSQPAAKPPHCGIIMPIGDTPGYDAGHWLEVRHLIVRAAQQAGYTAGMVSENDGQDVIHRSIVKNIYHNPLVVCDVSSLNPNVMLELGLRMANKKPLIVIFDEVGAYPFDIKSMLYIPYPKGLHHFKVETFVQQLTERIVQVTANDKAGKYEPFLNHFNDVVIEESKLGITTQTMVETLANLVDEVKNMKSDLLKRPAVTGVKRIHTAPVVELQGMTDQEERIVKEAVANAVNHHLKTSPQIPIGQIDRFGIMYNIRAKYRDVFRDMPASELDARFSAIEGNISAYVNNVVR